ncbi:MAG: arsenate reductase ArsC [Candidatus Competibacteraceae bacterium]
MYHPIRVLFICYRNSIRSQLAEALLRRLGADDFQVFSAGIQPEPLDTLAMEIMGALGIDISGHMSIAIDHFFGQEFDYIITLCDKAQPYVGEFSGEHVHLRWHLPDPIEFVGNDDNKRQLLHLLCVELTERIRLWIAMERHKLSEEGILEPDSYPRRVGWIH